jgi:hypothetical protein
MVLMSRYVKQALPPEKTVLLVVMPFPTAGRDRTLRWTVAPVLMPRLTAELGPVLCLAARPGMRLCHPGMSGELMSDKPWTSKNAI